MNTREYYDILSTRIEYFVIILTISCLGKSDATTA